MPEAAGTESRPDAAILEQTAPVVDVQVVALAPQMGHEQVFVPVVVGVARIDAHAALSRAVRAQRGSGQQAGVSERPVLLVDPEQVLVSVVGHVDVDPAVPVEVGGRNAERRPKVPPDQRRGGNVDEPSGALIPIQAIRLRAVHAWRAVVPAAGRARALDIGVGAVVHVVPHVQVQPSVPVVVDERSRHAPAGIIRTGLPRHVGEGPVAVVSQ